MNEEAVSEDRATAMAAAAHEDRDEGGGEPNGATSVPQYWPFSANSRCTATR